LKSLFPLGIPPARALQVHFEGCQRQFVLHDTRKDDLIAMSTLLSWGRGDHGQLGLGGGLSEPFVSRPTATAEPGPWNESGQEDSGELDALTQLCGGRRHAVALSGRGRVFTCGSNDSYQLGHDRTQSRFVMVEALAAYKIKAVASGEAHVMAVDEWGKVYAWG